MTTSEAKVKVTNKDTLIHLSSLPCVCIPVVIDRYPSTIQTRCVAVRRICTRVFSAEYTEMSVSSPMKETLTHAASTSPILKRAEMDKASVIKSA